MGHYLLQKQCKEGLGNCIVSSSQSCDRTRLDHENKGSLSQWLKSFLCRGSILGPKNLKPLTFQDSLQHAPFYISSSSVPNRLQTAPLPARDRWGRPRSDHPAANSGTAMKRRMGTSLRSRDYREAARGHAYRVPFVHGGAAGGVSHKTALGKVSLRNQCCGWTHLHLREHTFSQPKSFLRGHWRTWDIT